MTLLRLARHLFDVVTYAPARSTTVTPARLTFISGGRTRTVRDRRRRTPQRRPSSALTLSAAIHQETTDERRP